MSSMYCSTHKCKRTAHGHMSQVTRRPLCEICWGVEIDGINFARTQLSNPGAQEEQRRGEYLALVLDLKPITTGEDKGRFMLGEGYHTKTHLGLFRTIQLIILDGVR